MYLNCGHYFCRECFSSYFEYLVTNNRIYSMKCPNQNCSTIVTEKQVNELLSSNMFDKFKRFKLNLEVSKSKNKKFCPYPDCENVVEAQPNATKVLCLKCKKDICFKCQVPWH